jgi:enoyl-CoA hydratase/carnithine racemase
MSVIDVQRPHPEITLVILNRPEKLNALSFELVEELHGALDDVGSDNSSRVVILTGAGRGFCSGLDLTALGPSPTAAGTKGPRSGMRSQERIADLPSRLRRLHQPVIAAVNGPAYGGGFALALASDLRVASTSARFCSQFIKVGVGGCDIGISYTLPRLIGAARAFELMLTAREVDAAEAHQLGLVTDVVADGQVVERAMELAELICSYTPFGVEMTKQVMWANLDAPSLEVALHMENRTQILAGTAGELTKAAAAFVERKSAHP